MLALVACQPGFPEPTSASTTGVVISADGPNASEVTSFSLRTQAGETIHFTVGRLDLTNGGLPAPHLRDHLRSGEPITVDYAPRDGTFVALRYVDAP